MMHDPHDNPTPNPDRNNKSLFFIFFLLSASFKAKGIVDETVFPNNFKLLKTFCLDKLSASPSDSKINLLP